MLRKGRAESPGLRFFARMRPLAVLAAMVAMMAAAGCASRSDSITSGDPAAGKPGGPAVISGATIMAEGEVPRLLLTGSGSLAPTVYSRESSTKIVIDVPNAVASPGLEPPRADGKFLTAVAMKSFSELGSPHVQFELTSRMPLDPRISNEPGSSAMAIAFVKPAAAPKMAAPETTLASASAENSGAAPEPAIPAEPAVKVENLPTSPAPAASSGVVLASAPSRSAPPVDPNAPPEPVRHPASAGKKATRLTTVATSVRPGAVSVAIAGDGSFAWDTFPLANPPRFVVDLPGVQNGTTRKVQEVQKGALARVRVSQFRGGPDPVARVVFDLAPGAPSPEITAGPKGLLVVFKPGSPVPAALAAEAGKPSVPAALTLDAAPVLVAEKAPASGSYEKHEIEDPHETVVQVSAPAAPAAVDVRNDAPVLVSAPPPKIEAAPQLVTSSPEVRIPATTEQAPAPKPPAKKKRQTAEDRALVEAAEALLMQQEGGKGARDLANPYEARTLGAGDKQYTGEPITLNLKDADIKDTLQRFSELTQLNIVLDPEVRGTVTVSLTDIPWDQALELILKINQLGYVLEGNVMRIASTGKLAQEESAKLAFLRAQDANRPVKTVLQKLSYSNASEIAGTAKKVMSSRGDIFIDQRSNTLIIKELPDYLPTVLDLIKNLDIPNPQVMIETRIVEATRTFSNSLGVEWNFTGVSDAAHGNTTGLIFPNNGAVTGNVSVPSGAPQVLKFAFGNVLDTFKLDIALHAAESRGLVKVVSSPKVQTQTGETASIQSGFQIPVQTTVNNTTTVLYINATLRLDVVPQITNEGTVIMDVTVQKREPAAGINIAGGQNIPLTTRDAKTRLMVRDGGTAVIGGIFKLTSNDSMSMIPGLWKIPILGNLFKSRDIQENSDELMIFITPRIMR